MLATNLNQLTAYDYTLPPELVAHRPAPQRDAARLLVAGGAGISTRHHFSDLETLLQAGDVLVMNNTRVLPARLMGWRHKAELHPEGEKQGKLMVEVLLHRATATPYVWSAFCRPAKKLKPDQILHFPGGEAEILERNGEETYLKFKNFGTDFEAFLNKAGQMPLPPYIERPEGSHEEDAERYQTVYANPQGAVAAPTAGLHFTEDLLVKLQAKGVKLAFVTLHVGAGTFQPVRENDLSQHKMHKEWGEVTQTTATMLNAAKANGQRLICVGTTSLRLLETAAKNGQIMPFSGDTDIFITPGFTFNAADGLITNFHLPKSTLLMLVAAFIGYEAMQKIYKTAINESFRFYSYGDSSLLWRGEHA